MKTAWRTRAAIDRRRRQDQAALNELEQASHAFNKVLESAAAWRPRRRGWREAGPAGRGGRARRVTMTIGAEFEVKDN